MGFERRGEMAQTEAQLIGDRYEVIRTLGSGGTARVYLACDTRLHREVAIKVLNAESSADPEFVERFRREARAAARLTHPSIVAVYDWGELPAGGHDGSSTYYMTMEYVPGETLKELIQRRGPLPQEEALRIAGQVASALEAAHAKGVIHRDVKPQNVLLSPDGGVKIADFGIARTTGLSQLTRTNVICGTVQYLSPEQARGLPVDERSDVYSLGVVLYEMLAGREPFAGGSPIEVALKHVGQDPEPLQVIRPGLSPRAYEVVTRALSKDPNARFASAGDMRTAIEGAMASRGSVPGDLIRETVPAQTTVVKQTPAAPRPRARRMERPPRSRTERSSLPAWLLAVPLLFLVAAGAALAYSHRPSGHGAAVPPPTTSAARLGSGTHHPGNHAGAAATTTAKRSSKLRPTAAPTHAPSVVPTTAPTAVPTVAPTIVPTVAAPAVPPASGNGIQGHGQGAQGKGKALGHLKHNPAASGAGPAGPPAPAAVVPAPTTPPVAAPAAPPAQSSASAPLATVRAFYADVSTRSFGAAASLWDPRMLAQYPPSQFINGRFSNVQSVRLLSSRLVSLNGNSATVAVTMAEFDVGGSAPRYWSGTWQLVRQGNAWLLDMPDLHAGS